jgi:hypothetical protein
VQANFSTVLKIHGALARAGIKFTGEDNFIDRTTDA